MFRTASLPQPPQTHMPTAFLEQNPTLFCFSCVNFTFTFTFKHYPIQLCANPLQQISSQNPSQKPTSQTLTPVLKEGVSGNNRLLRHSQVRCISKLASSHTQEELQGSENLESGCFLANRLEQKPEISSLSRISNILSNAQRHKDRVAVSQIQSSIGVDLGDARTGVASSLRGFAPRPVSVVQQGGDKLLAHLFKIAEKEGADEFVVGLPISAQSEETVQSHKVRSFVGRLARHAAERGWRVYLLSEYGTTQEALDYMLATGTSKRSRKDLIDAYAAVVLLHNYFEDGGSQAQLVLPKNTKLQELLWQSYRTNINRDNEEDF